MKIQIIELLVYAFYILILLFTPMFVYQNVNFLFTTDCNIFVKIAIIFSVILFVLFYMSLLHIIFGKTRK